MRPKILSILSLVAVLVPMLQTAQVILSSAQGLHSATLTEWDLYKYPHPNVTDHLVFDTVSSLLQHWPNTRLRNGHNIVPGTIPKGTLLYHGRIDNKLPAYPEWTAMDPEHAFLFCRNLYHLSQETECWHLTLMTSRPLKVVYFDGSSAAKLPYGSLDSQDLIAWGRNGKLFKDEGRRTRDLCEWGKNFGVDGFVRMEMSFEIILCDFNSGTSVISLVNLASGRTNVSIIPEFNAFEIVNAGSWHNRFPGETRIRLDLSKMVSFYDTQLASSLVAVRAGQERWDHRVQNISSKDLLAVKSKLEANLIRPDDAPNGIDWKTLLQVIVDRYSQRLELARYLLDVSHSTINSESDPDYILDLARKTQTQLRIMLTPYLLFSAAPSNLSDTTDLTWAIPIYKLCATTHTASMETLVRSMTNSERLLLRAVRGTSREICRVVTRMWSAGVYAGVDPLLHTKENPDIIDVTRLQDTWAKDLTRLMAWLDWSVWVKCPQCSPEEMCYLPTWPVSFPWLAPEPVPWPSKEGLETLDSFDLRSRVTEKTVSEMWSASTHTVLDEWIRPQPKCIRRTQPYMY